MENKKGKLIVIIGPSGSGKSELANQVILSNLLLVDNKRIPSDIFREDKEYYPELIKLTTDPNNSMFYAKKYITRDLREEDVGVIHSTVEDLKQQCDVIIPGYKEEDYIGLNTSELIEQIDNGKNPVIVTGFMDVLQLIMRTFMEKDRLQDIYTIGINCFLSDFDDYIKLERERHGANYDLNLATESANKRFLKSRTFAREFEMYKGILDYSVNNYRLKYIEDTDLKREAAVITGIISNRCLKSDRNLTVVFDFINADLTKIVPVANEEVTFIGMPKK